MGARHRLYLRISLGCVVPPVWGSLEWYTFPSRMVDELGPRNTLFFQHLHGSLCVMLTYFVVAGKPCLITDKAA